MGAVRVTMTEGRGFEPLRACAQRFSRPARRWTPVPPRPLTYPPARAYARRLRGRAPSLPSFPPPSGGDWGETSGAAHEGIRAPDLRAASGCIDLGVIALSHEKDDQLGDRQRH